MAGDRREEEIRLIFGAFGDLDGFGLPGKGYTDAGLLRPMLGQNQAKL